MSDSTTQTETAIVRATFATAATYRQSPDPQRGEAFDTWLAGVQAAAWAAGAAAMDKQARRAFACERPEPLINPYDKTVVTLSAPTARR